MTIQEFIRKHDRKISASALLAGFLWDALTLTRIDYFFEVLVLGTHTSLIITWILLINIIEGKNLSGWFFRNIRSVAPILMQVSFGALFSALTIFYIKSASITTTLIFVAILLGLLVGNEFFRQKYQKLIFQFSVLFIAIVSFFALYIPVLVGSVGAWVFVLANVSAVLSIIILLQFLKFFVPERVLSSRKGLTRSIASIVIILQLLYFSNIIPPVPLALKDKGVYHDVYRSGISYVGTSEEESLLEKIIPGKTIKYVEGESISVYSAIFAPAGLSTEIAHSWEYYNTKEGSWIPQGKIHFSIQGGRDDGFRVFSEKSNLLEGKWRVKVVTKRDQVLGKINFDLKLVETFVETTAENL